MEFIAKIINGKKPKSNLEKKTALLTKIYETMVNPI